MGVEIEARFLEINKSQLIKQLQSIGAHDKGEALLSEVIFYDREGKWVDEHRLVRIRSTDNTVHLTYKHNLLQTIDSTQEIEFAVPDALITEQFLEAIGLVAFRRQEKKRHTFEKDGVTIDIDTWPKIPTFVEIEGPSEAAIRATAQSLGLDWKDVVFDSPRVVIEKRYGIPLGTLHWFTFDRVA